jgi:hypothetical protein
VAINASPEPISNWAASLAEDVAVVAGIWTALHYPLVFIGFLLAFALLGVWLLPKIWRGIRRVFSTLTRLFGGGGARVSELPAPAPRPRLTV